MGGNGIHRTTQAQLIRRGGRVGAKKVNPEEAGGGLPKQSVLLMRRLPMGGG